MKKCLLLLLGILIAGCCGCSRAPLDPDSDASMPVADASTPAETPLRGVWFSYLDWQEFIRGDAVETATRLDVVMDTCQSFGLNTVYFHVRSHSDAYYRSTVFSPARGVEDLLQEGFDPLAYAIEAAHKRGLSLHAWMNPYRIGKDASHKAASVTDENGVFCHNGVYYYNPASEQARSVVLDGVREILTRYAVDGIHFDDYFYPAGMSQTAEDFESVPAGVSVGDWRRTQVDMLVSGVWGLTHAMGKVFSISPMASPSRCKNEAYADIPRWMEQGGYADMICPQLYMGFRHQSSPFLTILDTWCALPRADTVSLTVGLAFYKCGWENDPYAGSGSAEWSQSADMIARQTKEAEQKTDGVVLFRYAQLVDPALAREREAWHRYLSAAE